MNDDNDENEILNSDITYTEVSRALGKMRSNKAAGEDGITAEFVKGLPVVWINELAGITNEIFKKGELIKGWEVARIYPIYKSADEDEVVNYRGVALLDVGYKLLTNILTNRIKKWLEESRGLNESQAGIYQRGEEPGTIFSR